MPYNKQVGKINYHNDIKMKMITNIYEKWKSGKKDIYKIIYLQIYKKSFMSKLSVFCCNPMKN
jgi:hypothetical protein